MGIRGLILAAYRQLFGFHAHILMRETDEDNRFVRAGARLSGEQVLGSSNDLSAAQPQSKHHDEHKKQ